MAGAANKFKVDIPVLTGEGGYAEAEKFFRQVEIFKDFTDIGDKQLCTAVRSRLEDKALLWYEGWKEGNAAKIHVWKDFKEALEKEFKKALNPLQLAELERDLPQRPNEPVATFFQRCRRYMQEVTCTVPDANRQEDGFKRMYEDRLKSLYINGMRKELRDKIGETLIKGTAEEVSTKALTVEESLFMGANAAKAATAKSFYRTSTETAGVTVKKEPTEVGSLNVSSLADALVEAFERRDGGGGRGRGGGRGNFRGGRGGRGGGRGGRGGGGGRNGPDRRGPVNRNLAKADKSKKPSDDVLKQREKQTCKRCGLFTKHRTSECFTNLDSLEPGAKQKEAEPPSYQEAHGMDNTPGVMGLYLDARPGNF